MMTPTTSCSAGPKRAGFSLTELMIAIGIMAIGLAMVASLFPAALAINRRSTQEILGTIICENGIALTKVRFASGSVPTPSEQSDEMQILADDLRQDFLSQEMCRFPTGDMASPYGVVLMYRWIDMAEDSTGDPLTGFRLAEEADNVEEGHQLVAVAYKRLSEATGGGNPYTANPVTVEASYFDSGFPSPRRVNAQKALFRIGSPVIDRRSGQFATTTQIYNTFSTENNSSYGQAVLDRGVTFAANDSGRRVMFVVQEADHDRFSPAMSTMVTRVALDWR